MVQPNLTCFPRVVIALDFIKLKDFKKFLRPFGSTCLFLKIGYTSYYHLGYPLIEYLKKQGHYLFLDLKLHDIPYTLLGALDFFQSQTLTPDFITLHSSNGPHTIREITKQLIKSTINPVYVTLLTSLSDKDVMRMFENSKNKIIVNMIRFNQSSDNNYFVCSAHEVSLIKSKMPNAIVFCPGIVLDSTNKPFDQKRIATPQFAYEQGADFIIVGRAITASLDPYLTYQQLLKL